MENGDMKNCPYCREAIKSEAIKCRYCGSMLKEKRSASSGHWYRVNAGKKIAGVCTGIARELQAENYIIPLRLFFILSIFLSGFGLIVYIILWIIMPSPIDGPVRVKTSGEAAEAQYVQNGEKKVSPHKGTETQSAAVGLFLIFMGALLILGLIAQGHWIGLPFFGRLHFPGFFPSHFGIWGTWFPGIMTFLIIAGLLLILVEGLQFIRFFLGCGLVVIGTLLLVLFVPFMPKLFLLPVMLSVGAILVIIGIMKIIF